MGVLPSVLRHDYSQAEYGWKEYMGGKDRKKEESMKLKPLRTGLITLAALLTVGVTTPVLALEVPDKPINSAVYDPNDYLSQETEDEINRLNSLGDGQVGVAVIKSLKGGSVEEFANETARKWQIGFSDTNAGALIVLSVEDRKSRIETSNVMSTHFTDADAGRALDDAKPALRAADYDGAIVGIAETIIDAYQTGTAIPEESGSEPVGEGETSTGSIGAILGVSAVGVVTLGAGVTAGAAFSKKNEEIDELKRENRRLRTRIDELFEEGSYYANLSRSLEKRIRDMDEERHHKPRPAMKKPEPPKEAPKPKKVEQPVDQAAVAAAAVIAADEERKRREREDRERREREERERRRREEREERERRRREEEERRRRDEEESRRQNDFFSSSSSWSGGGFDGGGASGDW